MQMIGREGSVVVLVMAFLVLQVWGKGLDQMVLVM